MSNWSGWKLRQHCLTYAATGYDVNLYNCRDAAEILECVLRVSDKPWADASVVGGLVTAIGQVLALYSLTPRQGYRRRSEIETEKLIAEYRAAVTADVIKYL